VSGIMSETSLDVLSKKESNINLMLKNNGCRMENPFLWMQTLSFTGLPYYKLTDKGLVDVRRNEIFAIKEGDYTLQAFSLEYSC
jgi:adenine deaminase